MIGKNPKKKKQSASHGKTNKKRFSSNNHDSFFEGGDNKKRRRALDEEILSSDDEDREEFGGSQDVNDEIEDTEEEIKETALEKKKRLADELLNKLRAKYEKEEEEEEEDADEAKRDRQGEKDSLIAKLLQQEQLEESGRVRRAFASRVQEPETSRGFRYLVNHRQSVTGVALSEDDSRGFSASKDGTIVHWDVESGKPEKYKWPSEEVLKSHRVKEPQGRATKHSKHVLALAVSSDGRYMASGGLDRHVHLWDVRTREHIQAFPGHKGPVSCLAFRQGTTELFSGSFDRSIKIWNAEERTYINSLFGHQSDVLTIDSLRKERALTVGRDRTMHLWKVPEESQVVFRASASSLECCCFINNDEYLSGSDDGSIAQWHVMRKKPVDLVKDAHPPREGPKLEEDSNGEGLSNGLIENKKQDTVRHASALSWVSSVAVCRNSDLAASGGGNGLVRLWSIEDESKGLRSLFELPLVGFINSLAFAKSAKFLIAGVGQEPRLGRWARVSAAKNGVAIHPLELS